MNSGATARQRANPGSALDARLRRDLQSHEDAADTERLRPITQAYSNRYVWYVVVLLAVVNVFNYADRMVLSVLMPAIKTDLHLSDAQLGLLVGFAFFLFYAACGIPVARWADRGVRRNIIVITLSIWSVMTALSGAAQNYWHLLAARIGLGAGEAGCVPSAQSIISDYASLERRSSVFAVHSFGMSAGTMVGLVLAGWLGDVIGWRWTFVAIGLPGLALAVVVWLTLREPVRGASDEIQDDHTRPSLRATIAALWSCKTYRFAVLFYVLSGFAQAGLLQWWPSFYARVHELSLSAVGVQLGLAIGAGACVGTILGGLLAHRAAQRDVRLPLMIGVVAVGLALPAAIASLFIPSSASSMVLGLLTILLWCVPTGPITATVYSVTKPRMRATAGAITIFCISIFGFGLGPLCVGVLSDALAPAFGTQSLRYALVFPVCILALVTASLYAVARALPGDLRAAGLSMSMPREGRNEVV